MDGPLLILAQDAPLGFSGEVLQPEPKDCSPPENPIPASLLFSLVPRTALAS